MVWVSCGFSKIAHEIIECRLFKVMSWFVKRHQKREGKLRKFYSWCHKFDVSYWSELIKFFHLMKTLKRKMSICLLVQ